MPSPLVVKAVSSDVSYCAPRVSARSFAGTADGMAGFFSGRLLQPCAASFGGAGSAACAGRLRGIASAVATMRVTGTRERRIRLFTFFLGLNEEIHPVLVAD
ncbi:hypothetical protein GCM10010415_23890 [Streptomyces atrovirens]